MSEPGSANVDWSFLHERDRMSFTRSPTSVSSSCLIWCARCCMTSSPGAPSWPGEC